MNNTLICFPCAGGNSGNFNRLAKQIDGNVLSVEYRGHWTRCNEPQYESMEKCIQDMIYQLYSSIRKNEDIILLGHSMGAIVAFETGKRLIETGYNVREMVLCACLPPEEIKCLNIDYNDDKKIISFLQSIRQIPSRVVESEMFFDNLLPAIKSDFCNLNRFVSDYSAGEQINCRITCMHADEDPLVKDVSGWQKHTNKKIVVRCYKGDHFFINDTNNIEEIGQYINDLWRC